MGSVRVKVDLDSVITPRDSRALYELAHLIEEGCDTPVQVQRAESEAGEKDGGLVIALAIATLGVSSIGALVSALTYWMSQRPQYSVSVTSGDANLTVGNISADRLLKITEDIAQGHHPGLHVLVSKE